MGAKNAKTYEDLFCISQTKNPKEMVYDYDHETKQNQTEWSEEAPDNHETLLNTKVTHVSSYQKLKLILQPGKPAEVTFSIHLDFSGNNH